MKKLLVLILALTMVLAFTACRDDACESHVDENNDGICDVCETEIPNADDHPNPEDDKTNPEDEHTVHTDENKDGICDGCDSVFIDYAKPTVVGTILKNSLEKQFDEMKSLKVELDVEYIKDDSYWYFTTVTEGDEDIQVPENETDYVRGVLDLDVWLAKRGNSFDVKATLTAKGANDKDAELETTVDGETVYIIGDYLYVCADEGYYTKDELIPEDIKAVLEELSAIEFFDNEEKNELLEALGAEIATVFNIKDNKGSVSFDAKPAIDDFLAYVAALDLENDTLRGVIDDALALISPDLTAEVVLTEASRLAGLTVTEALAELDGWLTENYGTTLQGIYDSLVANPEFISVIETIMIESGDIDLSDPEQKEMLDAAIADVKAFKLADMITEAGIADVPLYDLIFSLIPAPVSEEEVTYPTKDELFAMINNTLDMTLFEFEEAYEIYIFSSAKMALSTLTVDQLNGKLDLNFTGILNLSSIDGAFNFDASTERESEVPDKKDTSRIALFVALKVSEISTTATEIAIPEDANVVDYDLLNGTFSNGKAWLDIWSYANGETGLYEVYFTLEIYDEVSGSTIEISAYDLTIEDMLGDEIVVENFSVYVDDIHYSVDEDSIVKIAIDLENDSFTVIEMPEVDLPSPLEIALENICIGYMGEYTLDSRITFLRSYSDFYQIIFADSEDYDAIEFTCTYNKDENVLDCTIISFSVESDHRLYPVDKQGGAWYGETEDLDEINAYLGGNTTFKLYIDSATNTFTYDAIPEILEEYRCEWPTE